MNHTSRINTSQAYLGVQRSVLGSPWRDRCDALTQSQAIAMMQVHGFGDILARVLAGRRVGLDKALDYLDPALRDLLPDPFCLRDMEPAVARLAEGITQGETIAIFGDYDVDGAASAALLACYLEACGLAALIHIPDRIFEGYGPNVDAIEALAGQGASLLVTVDCGTTSFEPLALAQRLGLSPIVLDHHQASENLPDALVVNPNRRDDLSGLGQLCAAGVTFMLLVALNRALREKTFFSASRPAPDLLASLDLVALATIADVAPLTGLNRAFVQKGLKVMRGRERPGLAALFDVTGADGPPNPYHLGFLIGPRINAGGRIGDAGLGAKLLTLTDGFEARRIAEELDRLNRDRQTLEAQTLAEAERQAQDCDENSAAVIVFGDGWHPGVVGLIASKLKEKFKRPAFAIGFNGTCFGTGSGRSIAGVDLGANIRKAVELGLLVKGGGHAMAAGLTIERGKIPEFKAFLHAGISASVEASLAGEALLIDAALTAGAATPGLLADLERAGPYGAGNPEPHFVLPAHKVADVSPVGTAHLRFKAQAGDGSKIDCIAFRAMGEPLGRALQQANGRALHFAGTLSLDHWGGREKVKFRLADLALADGSQVL